MKIVRHNSKERTGLYATGADFCRIFKEDMKSLYFLSLVLTADSGKAEQCFVSGLDDCHAGNQVFREWARSWARRVVIKNAIRIIFSRPENARHILNPANAKPANWPVDQTRSVPNELAAVLGLPAFERFAFVMAVLEGYSASDCALLLGCTRESLIAARVRALELVASSADRGTAAKENSLRAESPRDRGSVVEPTLQVRLATPA